MSEEVPEVFRGHLEECLRHLSNRVTSLVPKHTKNARVFRTPMVDFMGVSDSTVRQLLYGPSRVPKGESRIKLMFYLDLHGYKVIELQKMRRNLVLISVAELIGYSVVPALEAAQLLGYYYGSEGGKDASALYHVLDEVDGLSKEKEERMWDLWKEKRGLLENKKKEALHKNKLVFLLSADEPSLLKKPSASVAVAAILDGLLMLVEMLPGDELNELRSLMHTTPRLRSLLDSSTALEQGGEGGKGGPRDV